MQPIYQHHLIKPCSVISSDTFLPLSTPTKLTRIRKQTLDQWVKTHQTDQCGTDIYSSKLIKPENRWFKLGNAGFYWSMGNCIIHQHQHSFQVMNCLWHCKLHLNVSLIRKKTHWRREGITLEYVASNVLY